MMSKSINVLPAYVAGKDEFISRVYECCRCFVWYALALLLLVGALLPAALDARLSAIHEKGLMQAAVVLVDSTDGEWMKWNAA